MYSEEKLCVLSKRAKYTNREKAHESKALFEGKRNVFGPELDVFFMMFWLFFLSVGGQTSKIFVCIFIFWLQPTLQQRQKKI